MDRRLNEACHKALNAIIMSDYLTRTQIAEAIAPYSAVDNVIAELKEKGYVTGYGFQCYRITPLGKECSDYYMELLKEEVRAIKDRKRIVIQSWISICISLLALIVSVVAILLNLGLLG